jgi:hypothetical protein
MSTISPIYGKFFEVYASSDNGASYEKIGNVSSKGVSRSRGTIDITTDESINDDEFLPERQNSSGSFDFVVTRESVSQIKTYDALDAAMEDADMLLFRYQEGTNDFTLRKGFFTEFSITAETRDVVKGSCQIQFTGKRIDTGSES